MTETGFYRKMKVLLINFFWMKFLKANWLSLAISVLVVVWLMVYGVSNQGKPAAINPDTIFSDGNIKALAQCLTDKGFKLYGAVWCGHCKEQKALFKQVVGLLNYVECSIPNSTDQTEVCTKAGITGYPTWGLPDGTKIPGVMTLKQLAETSNCPVK